MAVLLGETVLEIKSLLDYAMYRTNDDEQIQDALHRISWALNRDTMYKSDNLELQQKNEAIEIAEIDKTIEKLTNIKKQLEQKISLDNHK